MTEFALIVPVFLLIVVGMLVFGRLLFYWIETNHVASETARWAVVDRNPYGPGQTSRQSCTRRAAATERVRGQRRRLHRLSRTRTGMPRTWSRVIPCASACRSRSAS